MKKVLLVLLAIMLVGCSGEGTEKNKEENVKKEEIVKEEKVVPVKYEEVDPESKATIEKFVKKYNVRVDVYKQDTEEPIELEKIPEPITSELNKEENILSQILLETDFKKYKGHYKIVAKYNEDKKLVGYNISVEGSPINEVSEEGDEWEEGLLAAMSIIDAIGLNLDKNEVEFDKAIDEEKDTHTYTDSNYNVTFLLADLDLGTYEINYDLTN
ncbi:hypothetical protein [Lysinibacillus sphaericus]|uniref:Lipoprotein n=1 Tax=Lysinibacillus sphaericus OT4b.31 TaxID=1285586 RepID=R7ZJB7_LYSSH|nr:hypothetical protein [Lysinibacillus sphaericus]EON74146.1 hypothetical protein H131_01653 [Lysinibacillus sphaericus OT4b.31]